MINLESLCISARETVKVAVDFIREQSLNFKTDHIQYKGFNDMVSYVDKTSEEILVKGLSEILPGCGFITEENTANSVSERYKWIIDPLDGTTNFVHGVPCYCVSVALLDNDKTVIGIVHEVNLNECFYAYEGSETKLNDNTVTVSSTESLSKSLIVTGFPYNNFDRLPQYMKVFDYCMKNTHGIRRPGSAAIDLAYVAAGRYEAFYEYGLNSWDVAAGAFLVQQAGGKVSDFSGGNNYLFGKEIIASNKLVYNPFAEVIKEIMAN